jgi:hypothetical protein
VEPAAQAAPAAPAPTVAPETDFEYDLAAGGKGVKIRGYAPASSKTEVIVPSEIEGLPVVEIGDDAFSPGMIGASINIVILPDTVTKLGGGVFNPAGGKSYYTKITLSKNITVIPDMTFLGCTGLQEVNIPDGVKTIGENAFQGCSSLTSLTLPSGLTTIDSQAFSFCDNLRDLVIPDSIQKLRIGSEAFADCGKLTLAARSKLQALGYKGRF